MNIFIFLPAFLIFIYCLFKLAKDDYVLIRKNVSTEQVFDVFFLVTLISLFFSRLLFVIINQKFDNIFLSFFSLQTTDFSLPGLTTGWVLGLYLISKYKKLPIPRLFDFFTMAFAVSIPIGFLSYMLFFKEYLLLLYFFNVVIFSVFAFYLIKKMHYKFIIFFIFSSLIFLVNSILFQVIKKQGLINTENILLSLLVIVGLVFYFRKK